MSKHKIVVNSNCYHGYSIDEAIDGIAASGAKYIELTATKGWTEHVFPNLAFEELQRIKDKLQETGIEVIGMSGHCNLMDPDRLPDFISNIHLAHFFKSQYIVSSIGEAHLEDKAHQTNESVAQTISKLIPLLTEYDMTLVLEVHGDHGTGVIINDIVQRIGSERVKIAYDTANAVFYGGVNPSEDLKACIENVEYVHIKDKDGEQKEWNFPTLGKGKLDLKHFIHVLDEVRQQCPLSIEIEFTQEGPKDLDEVNKAVYDSVKYLEEEIV